MDSSHDAQKLHDLRSALTRLELFLKLIETPGDASNFQSDPAQWKGLIQSANEAILTLKTELKI